MTATDRSDRPSPRVDEWRGEPVAESDDGFGRAGRIASAVAGGVLVFVGLSRRGPGGLLSAIAGGWLVYRGIRGRNPVDPLPVESLPVGGAGADRGHELAAEAGGVETSRSITVGRPPEEVYEHWRDPETLSAVVGEYATVTAPTEETRRWEVAGPRGWTTAWDERIVEDEPGEVVRWESAQDERVNTRGTVRFREAPGDRGTEVSLRFRLDPPGGAIGDAAAERLGFVPQTVVDRALSRFKSYVETGEVPTLEKNPSGRGRGDLV